MIGLICPMNRKYAPFVEYYTYLFDAYKIPYEIITWDQAGIIEKTNYKFTFFVNNQNKIKMLFGYLGFSIFCKRLLGTNKYDKLIVFTIAPAIFLADILLTKYKNRFILDIRDNSPLTRIMPKLFTKLCVQACQVVVSSPYYRSWTKEQAHLCHNVDLQTVTSHIDDRIDIQFSQPIRVIFAGTMIEEEINISLAKKLSNNPDFLLIYYGTDNRGKKQIENYCRENDIQNIIFCGSYEKQHVVQIYKENGDFANIIRKKSTINKDALPNKMYDAVIAGKPILVLEHNEAIVEYIKAYNLGIILSEKEFDSAQESLLQRISQFDTKKYIIGRNKFLLKVNKDFEYFYEFLRSWGQK